MEEQKKKWSLQHIRTRYHFDIPTLAREAVLSLTLFLGYRRSKKGKREEEMRDVEQLLILLLAHLSERRDQGKMRSS